MKLPVFLALILVSTVVAENVWHTAEVRVKRMLTGSNCINVGGGDEPVHPECEGCQEERANACVIDMRLNASGTVSPQCDFNTLNPSAEDQADSCCPRTEKYTRKGNPRYDTLVYTTSAYPKAFSCLETVACADSRVYTDLMAECVGLCGNESTCLALSPASSLWTSTSGWTVAMSVAAMTTLLMLMGV